MSFADAAPDATTSQAAGHPGVRTSGASTSTAPVLCGEELAAMIRRAQGLDIPPWRVMTALGVPLPVGGPCHH